MTITVCIPVWNGAAFVEETLEDVRAQTTDDLVVLISVDKSDDRSLAICRSFAETDRRFEVFAQKERLGWVGNVNWLLQRVETEFACVLPHDDLIAPDYLERLLGALSSHPHAVLAHCDIQSFGDLLDVIPGRDISGARFDRILRFIKENLNAVAWHGVFRSEILRRRCYLDEANGAAADQVWLLRAVIEGDVVRVPETLYRKRFHDASVVAQVLDDTGRPTDTHWLDHCASCHLIALNAGDWDSEQKQAIADACLARAMVMAPSGPREALTAYMGDYARRVSGIAVS